MDNLINLKDANGQFVVISQQEIVDAMSKGTFTIFGLTLPQISIAIQKARHLDAQTLGKKEK